MDPQKIDQILLFSLLEASRQDEAWDRELGPIHLVKYVYLADLAYSELCNGQIFSGAAWKFHHYGPWDAAVHQRIDVLVEEVGVKKKIISSPKFKDDFVRYFYADDYKYDELYRLLPIEITTALRKAIRDFGKDTAELLHYVYRTRPMIHAAPGEYLNFKYFEKDGRGDAVVRFTKKLSVKRKRQKKQAIESLKKKIAAKHQEMREQEKEWRDFTPPRYDEVYFEGLKYFDRISTPPPEVEGILEISDEFWKSDFRTDDEIS